MNIFLRAAYWLDASTEVLVCSTKGKMSLHVHAVDNGEEKNAKWVGPNCFCSLTTVDN